MTRESPPRIFISHVQDDVSYVAKIREFLTAHACEVLVPRDVSAIDKSVRDAVVHTITRAEVCIVLLSARSMRSSWVLEEAKIAAEQKKLLPIAIGDFSWKSAPRPIWDLANHVTKFEASKAFALWLGSEVKDRCSASSYWARPTRSFKHPVFHIAKTPRELARCEDRFAGRSALSTYWLDTPSDWASRLDRRPMSDDDCLFPADDDTATKLVLLNNYKRRRPSHLRVVVDSPLPLHDESPDVGTAEPLTHSDGERGRVTVKWFNGPRANSEKSGSGLEAKIHLVTDEDGKVLGSSSVFETDSGDVLRTETPSSVKSDADRRATGLLLTSLLVSWATLDAQTRGRDIYSFVDADSEDEDIVFSRLEWVPVPDQALDQDIKACRERQSGSAVRTLRASESSAARAEEWLESSQCLAELPKSLLGFRLVDVRELLPPEDEPAHTSSAKSKR